MGDGANGQFVGELAITPVGDGVHWQLLKEFGFVDKRELRWMVPEKTRVDGASIPQALWSIVGSPFTGKYVQASVIHDYYCDVRIRKWQHVHRIFLEAMLVSGVSETRAKVMYAAVYFAGPRWSDTVIHNNNLDRLFSVTASRFTKGLSAIVDADGKSVREIFEDSDRFQIPSSLELDLDGLESLITEFNPSLQEINEGLDASISVAQGFSVDRQLRGTGHLAE
jgi:hypothetical protein